MNIKNKPTIPDYSFEPPTAFVFIAVLIFVGVKIEGGFAGVFIADFASIGVCRRCCRSVQEIC